MSGLLLGGEKVTKKPADNEKDNSGSSTKAACKSRSGVAASSQARRPCRVQSESLHGERAAVDFLKQVSERSEAGDLLDMVGMQQAIGHLESKKGLHPVVGKAFPDFGKCKIPKTLRVADEVAILRMGASGRVSKAIHLAGSDLVDGPALVSLPSSIAT